MLAVDDFALVLDANGTELRLTVLATEPEPTATSAGWLLDDPAPTVRDLASAGMVFERFNGTDQNEHGVQTSSSGAAVARFRDPMATLRTVATQREVTWPTADATRVTLGRRASIVS